MVISILGKIYRLNVNLALAEYLPIIRLIEGFDSLNLDTLKSIIMKFDNIKQQVTILDQKLLIQIKGGTNDSTTSTAIIGVDVDVI